MVCSHIYRRGHVFWWRRVLRCQDGTITFALSLKEHDPARALAVGRQLSAITEAGMITQNFAATSRDLVTAVLRDFRDTYRLDLEARFQSDLRDVLHGDATGDVLARRCRENEIYAALYDIAADHGAHARWTPELARECKAQGLTDFHCDKIAHRLGHGFARAVYEPGSTIAGTPGLDAIDAELRARGVEPNELARERIFRAIARAQARHLREIAARYRDLLSAPNGRLPEPRPCARVEFVDGAGYAMPPYRSADALEKLDAAGLAAFLERSVAPIAVDEAADRPAEAEQVQPAKPAQTSSALDHQFAWCAPSYPIMRVKYADTVLPADASSHGASVASAFAPTPPPPIAPPSAPDVVPTCQIMGAPPAPVPAQPPLAPMMLPQPTGKSLTEVLEAAIALKGAAWGETSVSQQRSVAELFNKMVGVDLAAALTRENVLKYRTLLNALPVFRGRRQEDLTLSIEELISRAEKDNKPRGLGPATINRHMTQLRAIVDHAVLMGAIADPAISWNKLRASDDREDDEKRGTFKPAQISSLLAQPAWADPKNSVAPSLYWAVLIALYSGARLTEIAGLKVEDIDLDQMFIHFRPNANRRLKTPKARREVPLHPEMERLQFRAYVALVAKRFGADADLFPDLRARSETGAHGVLLFKQFKTVLDRAIPNATQQDLCFHSFRHFVNGTAIRLGHSEAIRCKLLGHSGSSVNTKIYVEPLEADALARFVAQFPSVTSQLVPRVWREADLIPDRVRRRRRRSAP